MKILFVWRQYHQMVGGVERTSIDLMNEMCRRGHDVHLMSWDNSGAQSYYPMDNRIQWFKIDYGDSHKRAGLKTRIQRILIIRKYIKSICPDVVMAYMDGVFLATKISILGLGIPVIEAERCAVSRFNFLGSSFKTWVVFQSLRMAANITVQIESYRNDYPSFLRHKIVSISNPVSTACDYADPFGYGVSPKILLSVGRLAYQKNYSALIKAFAQIAKNFPDWKLLIAGNGEEREGLLSLILQNEMNGRIVLLGETSDVQSLYKSAHMFCLPSRWEGFPNALAEALAHGLPSVGMQDCAGVKDLIIHDNNGLLSSEDGLSNALAKLMKDDDLRQKMGAQAILSVQKYAPKNIFDQWEALFSSFNNH